MFSRKKLLYWIVLGFAGGVVVYELTKGRMAFLWVIITCALCSAAVFAIFHKRVTSKNTGKNIGKNTAILLLIISSSVAGGFLRSHLTQILNDRPNPLDTFVKEKVTLVAVLTEEQERRDFNNRLTVRVKEIGEGSGAVVGSNQKILVTTGNPKEFHYGDIVRIKGELTRPENFYTDTGREFDYVGYLQTAGTKFLIKNASVQVIGHDPPSRIIEGLFLAKRAFVNSLTRALPEPQSSLASGILIDGKQSINGELQEKFRKTGLIHIVVLSGSNVSIVAVAIGKMFMFLPRVAGMISASLGIVAFAMITGASATIVRASIMAILVLMSQMSLRNYDPARGLFLASMLMLIHNPLILLHSPSFQLSFLATFAVVKVIPSLEGGKIFTRAAGWISERFGLRELVVSNILVQAFLFPILTWMTGFFSAVSLPVNLLILPLIPFTMLAAFLTAMTGLVGLFLGPAFHFLALPFAFLSQSLLSYELMIVNFFAKFSLAEIPFGGFSSGVVAGFYIVTILWFLFFVKEGRKNPD